jgi:hypothetical protein
MHSSSSTRSGRTRLGLFSIAVALAAVAGACQVPTTPTTTTTTTTTSTTTTVPAVPAITVDPQPSNITPGSTVTVTGTGYDADGYIGTRPPFSGQPAGVYVVFARLGDPWRPSQSAPSSSRQIITQVWALPQAQHDALDPDGSNPAIVLMAPDGSFTADLALNEATGTGAYNVATYPASGAVDATAEVAVPVTFATAGE